MGLDTLVSHYGYAVVLVGAILEGEAVLILGAAAARLGYLQLPWVLAAAAVGAFIGDSFYFVLGRRYGARVTARFPRMQRAMPRIEALLERLRWGAVIALRFMYGLRTIGPVAVGASTMPTWQFIAANALGAVLWTAIVGGIGFAAGNAAERVLGDFRDAEIGVFALALAVAVGVFLVRFRRSRGPSTH